MNRKTRSAVEIGGIALWFTIGVSLTAIGKSMKVKQKPGAYSALALLLAINLFNYIDRQVLAALEPDIRDTFFAPNDPHAMTKMGLLADAFLVTYMISAPLLGWLADRFSRWMIVGCAITLWSLATGATGFAASFGALFLTRVLVGSARVVMARPHRQFWLTFFQSKSAGGFSRSFVQPSRSEAHWVTF